MKFLIINIYLYIKRTHLFLKLYSYQKFIIIYLIMNRIKINYFIYFILYINIFINIFINIYLLVYSLIYIHYIYLLVY